MTMGSAHSVRPAGLTPRHLALIPATVAINLVIGRLVAEIGLPVYLDTVGTMLASALGGLGVGIATGLLSQLLAGLLSGYQWLAFAPIQIIIAVAAWAAARHAGFRHLRMAVLWGIATGIAAGLLSAVISYLLFKGVTATGVTALVSVFQGFGLSLDRAVLGASLSTDLADKALSFALVGWLLRSLPRRMRARFPLATRAVGISS